MFLIVFASLVNILILPILINYSLLSKNFIAKIHLLFEKIFFNILNIFYTTIILKIFKKRNEVNDTNRNILLNLIDSITIKDIQK